jgi:vacuolar-type H+-ATPase subunit H
VKEVIVEILEEEKKARERVAEAQAKAKQIRESAETEAKRLTTEAKTGLQREIAAVLSTAESQAQKQKEKDMKQADDTGAKLWESKGKKIQAAVNEMFQAALGGEVR